MVEISIEWREIYSRIRAKWLVIRLYLELELIRVEIRVSVINLVINFNLVSVKLSIRE